MNTGFLADLAILYSGSDFCCAFCHHPPHTLCSCLGACLFFGGWMVGLFRQIFSSTGLQGLGQKFQQSHQVADAKFIKFIVNQLCVSISGE